MVEPNAKCPECGRDVIEAQHGDHVVRLEPSPVVRFRVDAMLYDDSFLGGSPARRLLATDQTVYESHVMKCPGVVLRQG